MQAPRDGGDRDAAPSQYWADELEHIDYLIDASPLVIRKLRHHAFHITGVRPYDYRGAGEQRAYFERRLRALTRLAGGSDLLLGDHDTLGGFGFEIDGRRHNVDTLKFFEVLVGMHRAGILEPFSRGDRRRMVVEIGAGWGGFAFQFKTLFPKTTYVIVDFPELFLFSATYLMTAFPGAAVRFWREERRDVRPMAGCRLHLHPEPARGRPAARAARSARQPGVVPGDDGNAGGDLRGTGRGGWMSGALQPESRPVAAQRRDRQRERDSVAALRSA